LIGDADDVVGIEGDGSGQQSGEPITLDANNIVGVTNQQGASRMRSLVY